MLSSIWARTPRLSVNERSRFLRALPRECVRTVQLADPKMKRTSKASVRHSARQPGAERPGCGANRGRLHRYSKPRAHSARFCSGTGKGLNHPGSPLAMHKYYNKLQKSRMHSKGDMQTGVTSKTGKENKSVLTYSVVACTDPICIALLLRETRTSMIFQIQPGPHTIHHRLINVL